MAISKSFFSNLKKRSSSQLNERIQLFQKDLFSHEHNPVKYDKKWTAFVFASSSNDWRQSRHGLITYQQSRDILSEDKIANSRGDWIDNWRKGLLQSSGNWIGPTLGSSHRDRSIHDNLSRFVYTEGWASAEYALSMCILRSLWFEPQWVDTWLTEFWIDRIRVVLQKGYILYV